MPDNITTMPIVADSEPKNSPVTNISSPVATPVASIVSSQEQKIQPSIDNQKPELKQAWVDMDKETEALKNAITAGVSKQGNVDIYAMPKEFQKHNTVAGSKFSLGTLVMIGGLVLFFLASSLTVLYFLNPDILTKITGISFGNSEPEQQASKVVSDQELLALIAPATSTVEIATTTATSTATSTPPKETYLAYNIEFGKINTFADYYLLVTKYGSARWIQQADAEKLIADSSSDLGAASVSVIKTKTPVLDPLVQIAEQVTDQTAQLNVVLPDNVSKGTVNMVLENGLWKIDNENWILPVAASQVAYIQGEDRDADGLTDAEEDLFGANKDNIDTDGDGYTDAVEVSGLYDPNKKAGKLVDSGKFATYLAENGYYSIIRPSQWSQSKDNTDNSINFRGLDDHYIKIVTAENFNKLDLDTLYINKFQVGQIDNLLRVASDSWSGIMSPDGLSLYVMPKISQSRYYIVEYHLPSNTQALEYKELFMAMIKSLVIKK